MEWRWLNEHRITWELDKIDDDEVLNELLDALDLILEDPQRADMTAPMQGTHDHVDRTIALLPHGWVVVYSIYPDGVLNGPSAPSLVVREFHRYFGIGDG